MSDNPILILLLTFLGFPALIGAAVAVPFLLGWSKIEHDPRPSADAYVIDNARDCMENPHSNRERMHRIYGTGHPSCDEFIERYRALLSR